LLFLASKRRVLEILKVIVDNTGLNGIKIKPVSTQD